jgi:EmrB/QacA subfamily drug resistance transporter
MSEGGSVSKRWTLFAVILGSGIVFLDSTIVPVALPRIGEELSSSWLGTLEGQSYVYYGYLLSLSALLILAGALTDYFGRRRMFAVGLIGFGVTSVLCGVAVNMEMLVLARVLQGAAGALLVPGSLAIITAMFEGEEQGRAFGIWAGASAATTILGPVIGGALVETISWRAAFWINVPLVVWALWATLTKMPESRDEEATRRVDWVGAIVVAAAVGGLTFGVIRGESQQWNDPVAFVSLVIGVLSSIAFPIWMARSPNPLVPIELFRSRNFNVTNISTLLIYGAIYVMVQFAALFMIGVLGYSEIGFGIATIPSTLFLALFSTKFGALADRFGPRVFMALGPAVMGLGLLWFVRMPADSEPWRFDLGEPSTFVPPRDLLVDVLPALVLFGIGLMIMVAPLTTALMRSVPVRHSGVASAFNNAVSRVGPQLAGALIFIAISASFYAYLTSEVSEIPPETAREQVTPLNPVDDDVEPRLQSAAHQASTRSFHVAMLVAALMCFGGAAVNAVGIRNPAKAPEEPLEPEEPKRHPVTPCHQSPPVEAPTT